MKKKIESLISSLGSHPSFSLPPVGKFIERLKEILEEDDNIQAKLIEKYGPYTKDDPRAKKGF